MERVRTGFEFSNKTGGTNNGARTELAAAAIPGIKRLETGLMPRITNSNTRQFDDLGGAFFGYWNQPVASEPQITGGYGKSNIAGIAGGSANSALVFDPAEYPNGMEISFRTSNLTAAGNNVDCIVDFKVSGNYYSVASRTSGAGNGRLRLYKDGIYQSGAGDVAFLATPGVEYEAKISIGMSAGTQHLKIDIDGGFVSHTFDIGVTIAGNLEEEIFFAAWSGGIHTWDDLSVNDDKVRLTFSGGGGFGAEGYATLTGGGDIDTTVITSPGTGYTSPPAVNFIGAGLSSRTLTAVVVSEEISSVTIGGSADAGLTGDNTGIPDMIRCYNLAQLESDGVDPAGNEWVQGGSILTGTPSGQIIDNNLGSWAGPKAINTFVGRKDTEAFSYGDVNTSGVLAYAQLVDDASGAFEINDGETVTLSGGSGTGATATVSIDGSGVITGVVVVLGGTGYDYGDDIVITGDTSSETQTYHVGTMPIAVDQTGIIHSINLFLGVFRQPIAGKKLIVQVHTDTSDVINETGGGAQLTNARIAQDGPITDNTKLVQLFRKPDGTQYDHDDLKVGSNEIISGLKLID